MAGITLDKAQAQLDLWLAADTAVAAGQSYSIQGRSFTRADARTITDKINYWNNWVNRLTNANGARVRFGVPLR